LTLRTAQDLAAAGLTELGASAQMQQVAAAYAVAITPEMAALIDRHDPADPIARQFVPSAAELEATAEELIDPISDEAFSPVTGTSIVIRTGCC
jgi:lysine 2,3-aminomutase